MKIKKIFKNIIIFFLIIIISVLLLFFNDNGKIEEKIKKHKIYGIIPKIGSKLYPKGGFKKILNLKDSFYGIRSNEQKNKNYSNNFLQLYKGFQDGLYQYDVWLSIKEKGKIYLKIFYLGTDIELSENRIKNDSLINVDRTYGKIKRFSIKRNFTIYEGDFGKQYGVRVELWYISDVAHREEKILEDYYIVEGWQR